MKRLKHFYTIACLLLLSLMVRAGMSRLYTSDKMTSSLIDCVMQDKYGFIWIGTEYGLNKFDGYRFTPYLYNKDDSTTIVDNEVVRLMSDSEGRLWVGCTYGLAQYDYHNDNFRRYRFPGNVRPRANALLETSNGDILIGTAGEGLFVIRKGEDKIRKLESFVKRDVDEFYSRIFEDDQHHLWRSSHLVTLTRITIKDGNPTEFKDYESPCGPPMSFIRTDNRGFIIICHHGILRYDYSTGEIDDAGYDLSVLSGKASILKARLDREGNLYLGTAGNGLYVIKKGSISAEIVNSDNNDFDLTSSNINDIMEDKDGNLWVSCYKKGLFQMSQHKDLFESYTFEKQGHSIGSSVSSLAIGDDNSILCTVQNSGVYRFDEKGKVSPMPNTLPTANNIYRDKRGQYWLCSENKVNKYSPSTGAMQTQLETDGWGLNCITDDSRGTLFICNYGKGLIVHNTNTGETQTYSMRDKDKARGVLCNDWIKALYYDSRGLLWIGTTSGVSCFDPEKQSFKPLGWDVQLNHVQCSAINENDKGNIIIGTHEGMFIYLRDQNKIEPFKNAEKLSDKTIYSITFDHAGDMWLSTSMGIWHYSPKDKQFIDHISGNGLITKEYILGAVIHNDDDMIAYGTSDGITTFYPEEVKKQHMEMGDIHLTNFIVDGKSMDCFQDHFSVPYNENSFTMEFSLLTFKNADNINFEYRINGGDTWTQTGEGNNSISFNKMKPGKYVIEVRALSNGVYSKNTKEIVVRVKDPWYSSIWAFILYGLLAAGIVTLGVYYIERKRMIEMEESKMKFLINATHDIRSPLTLIMGPLKKLKTKAFDEESLNDIETIDRNAQRLQQLVNQILDESKIDKKQMKLQCRETNLVQFINGIFTLYQYNAQQRNMHYTFEVETPEGRVKAREAKPVMAWIDRINFDKVISNLLSNAFKYTFDGGDINIVLAEENDNVVIRVIDNGIGLKESNTDKLFERFYQGSNARDVHLDGTGIGLNLSKAIVKLHGGTIKANNRTDGVRGTVLTVTLPKGNKHLAPDMIEDTTQHAAINAANANSKTRANKNFKILIADDEEEIASYIRNELGNWYRFDAAPNGKEALKALLTSDYDLVISDIIMPEMDGITLLKNIKGNPNISDVPVILLTSKAEVKDRLEGLRRGADAYLAKPFSMDELHILIDNLIDNVRRLRGKFSGAQRQEAKLEKMEVKSNNDELMDRIMKCINEHLSDPEFNVEKLTENVGISRAQLHRKMKEITGISAGDFIRNLRLEQAASLIRQHKINVTQVAYAVGFNNQTHFSTVFKKHFGVTPSEYAEQNHEDTPETLETVEKPDVSESPKENDNNQ